MKLSFRILLSIVLLIQAVFSAGQVVTTDPALPLAEEAVTIYFHAAEGDGGLAGYTGDIYAHTGVLTSESTSGSNWQYVKTDWGENTTETKLTRISTNEYKLEIGPSIREYYGVPSTIQITDMTFVFRAGDLSKTGRDEGGKDIFIEVFEAGFNVNIVSPDKNKLLAAGSTLDFEAAASESSTMVLYSNNTEVTSSSGTALIHRFTFNETGDFWLKIVASTATETDTDSVFVHVLGVENTDPLPSGLVDGINYIDENTVQLVLYAPGKNYVFVTGDFNNWTPSSAARMNHDGDRFWITLDGLTAGEEYAYQYLVDGEIYIADPYTEKVLDPWNDSYINESTYPNLKPYPGGYATGIVSVFQTAQDEYQWVNTAYTAPDNENLVIYELLVRDFIAAHDWKTLTDTLNYFSKLGVNAIELMPVNEFEGNESWGYNPSFYFAVDKYYGPAEDLKVFIDSCHGRGIAVIMDMVLNHSYGQSPLVQLYFNEATGKVTSDNPWYNVSSPNTAYSWGYDFNHESTATKLFVDRVNAFWMDEFNVDGFRFDFTKGFTNTSGDGYAYDADRITILKRMADRIWAVKPNAYVILEHFAENTEEKALSNYGMMIWGNISYNYEEAIMGYNESGKSDFNWISYKSRAWNDPHVVGYMESHDEERTMYKALQYGNSSGYYNIKTIYTAFNRVKLAAAFFFTIPGPKMIWQFEELGYDYSIDYNGRVGNKPIRWDYYEDALRMKIYNTYAALIDLKKTEPAFSSSTYSLSVYNPIKRIEISHSEMDVRILGNFDVVSGSINPNFSKTGTWYEFFSGDSLDVTGVSDEITLDAGEYKIYTTKKLKKPDIATVIEPITVEYDEIKVYPVPAEEIIFIDCGNKSIDYLAIFNLNGSQIKSWNNPGERNSVDISDLPAGIFVLKASFEDGSTGYTKLTKR